MMKLKIELTVIISDNKINNVWKGDLRSKPQIVLDDLITE